MNVNVNIEPVKGWEKIKEVLLMFEHVFPHLREKIPSFDEYAKKLEKFACVCICQINTETCGILVFYANDVKEKTSYISLIGVLETWQGKHVGKQLLDYCIDRSVTCGMKYLKLEVDLDNTVARKFYTRNGFHECNYASDTSIYMKKTLN